MNIQKSVDEKLPLNKLLLYAFQHILAMIDGTIAVPIVLSAALKLPVQDTALLISAAMFTSGLGSLIQSIGIKNYVGAKLPLILGTSFVALPPVFLITALHGGGLASLPYIFGGTLIAGLILFFVAPLYGLLSYLFKPVVIASYLIMLGVSLLSICLNNIVGYPDSKNFGSPIDIFLGLLTILVIILLNRFGKGILKSMSILVALVIGTVVAALIGHVDSTALKSAEWFSIVKPFHYGVKFEPFSIAIMTLATLMASFDSLGTFKAVGEICENPIDGKKLNAPMRGEGITVALTGLFNCTPLTSYINNAAVLIISGVRSRWVTICSGIMLLAFGLVPKFAALCTLMPTSVLGGATVVIFSLITVSGIEMVKKHIDLNNLGNMLIIAVSVGVGLMFNGRTDVLQKLPQFLQILLSQGVIVTFLLSILLNMLFNFKDLRKDINVETVDNQVIG